MLIRQLECSHCGAAIQAPDESATVFCMYCGAFANPDGVVYRPEQFDRSARMEELRTALYETQEDRDVVAWRLYCQEYYTLDVQLNSQMYPGVPEDPGAFREFIQKTVKQNELYTFDEEVVAANLAVMELFEQLVELDSGHVAAARRVLEGYRRYFGALIDHPEYPFEMPPGTVERMAVETTRSALQQYASIWGEPVMKRVLQRVLGDLEVRGNEIPCRACGTSLVTDGSDQVTCPSCGAVTFIDR
jgi:predicted RNA-binding Zn-ribbon protein involved in translation (DUF1610 family)